jgi:hypothetical protein
VLNLRASAQPDLVGSSMAAPVELLLHDEAEREDDPGDHARDGRPEPVSECAGSNQLRSSDRIHYQPDGEQGESPTRHCIRLLATPAGLARCACGGGPSTVMAPIMLAAPLAGAEAPADCAELVVRRAEREDRRRTR